MLSTGPEDFIVIPQKFQAKDGQAVHTCGSFRAKPQIGMCLVTRGATRFYVDVHRNQLGKKLDLGRTTVAEPLLGACVAGEVN